MIRAYNAILTVTAMALGAFLFFNANETRYDMNVCKNVMPVLPERVKCWRGVMERILDDKGLDAALRATIVSYEEDPEFGPECHNFDHLIGDYAYKQISRGRNVKITEETSYCGYGFYHGFVEAALAIDNSPLVAQDICDKVAAMSDERKEYVERSCYHGIGHGSVDGSDSRAWGDPQALMEPGLKLCDKVARTSIQHYLCITGVFNSMEKIGNTPKYGVSWIVKEPFNFCSQQVDYHKEPCYTNMTGPILEVLRHDYNRAIELIDAILERDDIYETRYLVIVSILDEYIRINVSKSNVLDYGLSVCQRAPEPRANGACLDGIVVGLLKNGMPEVEYKRVFDFCRMRDMSEDERERCFRYFLSTLPQWYSLDKVKQICDIVDARYRKYCENYFK